ncbi:aldo/keto reductase [Gloeomargaritales cyanobacterium VI4D9]|nr:aldo/keto reductase [Gloeomargaritales cyanobacterium VI4D9]
MKLSGTLHKKMRYLALGTAQFGLSYGIANQRGEVPVEEVREILATAREAGIDTLDTAIAYGTSEEKLGEIGVHNWKIITKLPKIPLDYSPLSHWVKASVINSLQRLKLEKLYGLLLHHPQDLLEDYGEDLYSALHSLRSCGLVEKIGISIYSPTELDQIWKTYKFDLVQAPFNGLDQRLVTSGWLQRLKEEGVEVHGRSLFLQGLLLLPEKELPQKFQRWQSLWTAWHTWLNEQGISPLAACLGAAWEQGQFRFHRIVVGVDSKKQLQEILAILETQLPSWPPHITTDELDLINPTHWNHL